jgi:hypothetical protein
VPSQNATAKGIEFWNKDVRKVTMARVRARKRWKRPGRGGHDVVGATSSLGGDFLVVEKENERKRMKLGRKLPLARWRCYCVGLWVKGRLEVQVVENDGGDGGGGDERRGHRQKVLGKQRSEVKRRRRPELRK